MPRIVCLVAIDISARKTPTKELDFVTKVDFFSVKRSSRKILGKSVCFALCSQCRERASRSVGFGLVCSVQLCSSTTPRIKTRSGSWFGTPELRARLALGHFKFAYHHARVVNKFGKTRNFLFSTQEPRARICGICNTQHRQQYKYINSNQVFR